MAEHEADRGQGRDPEDGEAVAAADSATDGGAPGTVAAGPPAGGSSPAGTETPETPGKSGTPDGPAVAEGTEPQAVAEDAEPEPTTGTSASQASTSPVTPPALDEEAAWQAIVSGYGQEPADPPGAAPFRPVRDLPLGDNFTFPDKASASERRTDKDSGTDADGKGTAGTPPSPDDAGSGSGSSPDTPEAGSSDRPGGDNHRRGPGSSAPLGGSVTFAPGLGPRDHTPPRGVDGEEGEDGDEGDEGFTPPEPPPLPESDATTRFAWLGMLGGPVLLLLAVILGWEMTWWLTTACVGGFLGGCATLVMRMDPGDDEDDDPGRGAVV